MHAKKICFSSGSQPLSHILPFIKQDYQIYPQYTQWCSFPKNTRLKNLQFEMIYKNLHLLQFMVQ